MLSSGCGGTGSAGSTGCGLCGEMADLTGSITSEANGQSQMRGWVVAMIEANTGMSRVGVVDTAGVYQLTRVRTGNKQTLAVLSPDFILLSVLSVPAATTNQIQQFFYPKAAFMPRLIQNGPIIGLQDFVGITMAPDVAVDDNGDGIPNGSQSIGAVASLTQKIHGFQLAAPTSAVADLDQDGVINTSDPDIDADGVVNWLDPDDDGDGTLDIFDVDANGDYTNDSVQALGDHYFTEGVEFIAVHFELKPKETGTGNEASLTFTTKVRTNVSPDTVQILGAPSLLAGALTTAVAEDGTVASVKWNGLLDDDGLSNDSAPDDRIFSKRVVLADGFAPRAQETVFFELGFNAATPWKIGFPFTFPSLKTSAISTQYDKNLRRVRLLGNPFGSQNQFTWSINIFDADGKVAWSSQQIPGTTTSFVHGDVLYANKKYKYSVVAKIQGIPGYPAYTIHSAKKDIQ